MRVLIAPQEFKGSLSAEEACAAIAEGLASARPGWQLDQVPLADGGPGFLDALARAVRLVEHRLTVGDALGRPVVARFAVGADGRAAYIEAAQSNGLVLIDPAERDPLRATTFGVGELIRAAVGTGARDLTVGVGGSATSDGGAGMALALGARMSDRAGRPIGPAGVVPLLDLARIDWDPGAYAGVRVTVAADVTNPLVGPEGAAAVYGPQKGATPAQVALIERALTRLADVVGRDLGVALADLPGAGAAGGLGGGLVAFLGARIVSGFDVVADATGLADRIRAADLVITGEGSYDTQSQRGKGPARLRDLAAGAGKRAVVFAGRASEGGPDVRTLADLEPDEAASMRRARELLSEAARRWAVEAG